MVKGCYLTGMSQLCELPSVTRPSGIISLSPQFAKDGFVAVPGFLNEAEVRSLTDACAALVEELDPEQHPATVFSSTDQQQVR